MPVAADELTERLSRLEEELQRVRSRLDRLEGRAPTPALAVEGAGGRAGIASHAETPGSAPGPGALALAGRTLLALGGGFLIRALTEGGFLPTAAGVVLGLAYALVWLALADRAAALGQHTSATFHGLACALLGYPLLWEATTRFGLLGPRSAAGLAALFLGASLVVAGRRRLGVVGWASTLLAIGTIAGFLFATRDVLAVVFGSLGIAIVVLGLALRDQQPALRWPTAALADAAVLVLVWLVARPGGPPPEYPVLSPALVLLAALALPAVFIGATVAQTLGRARRVDSFDAAQGAVALALGFGGGASVLVAQGQSPAALGVVGLLLGALSYWAAFIFVERRHAHGSSFYFYSTAGGVLTLLATGILLWRDSAALAWGALAVLMAGLGRRYDRLTLRHHAAAYVLAAALASGLLQGASRALLGGEISGGAATASLPALVVLAASLLAFGILADRRPDRTWWQRLPEAVPAALAAWGLGGLLVVIVAPWLVPLASARAAVATLRTAVLSLLAMAVAEAGRRPPLTVLGALVYPTLAVTGLKLVSEDLPSGNPATLFVSFALYGVALITAPRRLRKG